MRNPAVDLTRQQRTFAIVSGEPGSMSASFADLGEDNVNKPATIMPESGVDRSAKTGTVSSAMAILRLLAEREQAMGVNAIARELAIAPSSCFKILKSLLVEDCVEIDALTKGYSLGNGAIAIARRALDPLRAFATIRPRLEEAAQAYSIAIGLWRMQPNGRMVLIGFAEGINQMRIHMSIGQRLPALVGAVGRAIAADLDLSDAELEMGFRQLRWQVPLSFEEYRDQVRQAMERGYGYDSGNFSPGVHTVAVTIKDHLGIVRYGLSGIMFSGQHKPEMLDQIASELVDIAQWASTRLVSQPLR